MTDLKITKARLDLLQAVRDGVVWYSVGSGHGQYTLRAPSERWRTVTAKAGELREAGWIDRAPPGASYFTARPVRLLATGAEILAVHEERYVASLRAAALTQKETPEP